MAFKLQINKAKILGRWRINMMEVIDNVITKPKMEDFIDEKHRVEEEEIEGIKFIFCKESYKRFKEEFWIIEFPLLVCPNCSETRETNSNNDEKNGIHNYKDYFVCFSCKYKKQIRNDSIEWDLNADGLYLCKKKKGTNEKIYFHRWLMDFEIAQFYKKHYGNAGQAIVHHISHNPSDNRISNLKIMTAAEHKKHHEDSKSFDTWAAKSGDYDYNNFLIWKENKEGGDD